MLIQTVSRCGNEDGLIDSQDKIWEKLLLWNDFNADAVSNKDEMTIVTQSTLKAIDLVAQETNQIDDHGNWLRFISKAVKSVGKELTTIQTVDVYFVDYTDRRF